MKEFTNLSFFFYQENGNVTDKNDKIKIEVCLKVQLSNMMFYTFQHRKLT